MINELLKTGELLESEASESMGFKFFNSVNFETWVSKSILYLENYHKNSVLTEKAREGYKKLNSNNNYDYYQSLLGALRASKDFEKHQADSVSSIIEMNF
ncbi:hypothetical protein ACWM35_21415 [Neobacillus sp. K501]